MKTLRLVLPVLLLLLSACEKTPKDEDFVIKSKLMPPLHTVDGEMIDGSADVWIGQYGNMEGGSTQPFEGMPKGSIGSFWKVTYLKGGKPDFDKLCGERPKHKEYTRDELINESDRIERERAMYYKVKGERWDCYKKEQAKSKKREITHYYYARSKPKHTILYGKKKPDHGNWEATIYSGRVGDLTVDALSSEQKKNLGKFRSHHCYQFGSTRRGEKCYDLPGKESNIYYTVRSMSKYRNDMPEEEDNRWWNEYLDIRIASPVKWTEIEGIEIDKPMYDYLKDHCGYGETLCVLDQYKGKMTAKQKSYVLERKDY